MNFERYLNEIRKSLKIQEERLLIKEVLRFLEENEDKKIFFIILPTGYGKTSISLTLAKYVEKKGFKIIISLPLRTLLEDQYNKFLKIVENKEVIGKRYMSNPFSKYLIKPITLTTIDTLALTFLGISPEDIQLAMKEYFGIGRSKGHFLFSLFSIISSDFIVIDEVHLLIDNAKALSFLVTFLKYVSLFGVKIILLSATIPEKILKFLIEKVGEKNVAVFSWNHLNLEDRRSCKILDEKKDEKFYQFKRNKRIEDLELKFGIESEKEAIKYIIEKIKENLESYSKVLIVVNEVEFAISIYEKLKEINDLKVLRNDIILLHSKFSEEDKEEKIDILEKLKKKDKYVIVSTQVIEAGVDLSSNLLISEISPISSLIQRVGRFLRWNADKKGKIIIFDVKEHYRNKLYTVYDKDFIDRTKNVLKEIKKDSNLSEKLFLEYKDMLDRVYENVNLNIIGEDIPISLALVNLNRFSDITIEILLDKEGSLIRNSSLFSIIPKKYTSREKLEKFFIPIELGQMHKLLDKIVGFIREDLSTCYDKETINNLSNYIKSLKKKYIPSNFRRFIEFIYKKGIIALVVDVEYNKEYGLRL